MTATNSVALSMWTTYYGALKDISYLLWGLDKNQGSLTPEVYKNAKGEALFMRAYFHYLLATNWAHPSTGVPMYTDLVLSYEDTAMPISTPNKIYAQCIKDLVAAEALLEETGQTWESLGYSERVTLDAVRGFLPRVALSAAGFPNYGKLEDGTGAGTSATSLSDGQKYYFELARDYALKVTTMGHTLEENYEDVWIAAAEDRYVNEVIWEIGYTYYGADSSNDDLNTAGPVGANYGITRRPEYYNGSDMYDSMPVNGYCYAHPRLIMSYGHGDARRYWNAPEFAYEFNTHVKLPATTNLATMVSDANGGVDTSATWYYPSANLWNKPIGKWRREHEDLSIYRTSSGSTSVNYPLLRYTDVLLMLAEAYIELGEPATAAPYINQVRSRAIKEDAHMTVTHVVVDNSTNANDRGYCFHPEIDADPNYFEVTDAKGGSGLRLRVTSDRRSYARLKVGILDGGSGYTEAPSITVQDKRANWEAGKTFAFRDYCGVLTYNLNESTDDEGNTVYDDLGEVVYDTVWYVNMYENTGQDAVTSSVAPDFTDDDLYSDTELVALFGAEWDYQGRWTLDAPTIHTKIGMSEAPDVADHVSITNQEAMRDFVRKERMRELCFEGLRRDDLKRWGILYTTMKGLGDDYTSGNDEYHIYPDYSGTTSTNVTTDISTGIVENQLYFPIPNAQLSMNRNLIQNPGY